VDCFPHEAAGSKDVLTNSPRDPFENLTETQELFLNKLNLTIDKPECELFRRLAELIGTRAARLSACGIAAICKKKGYESCHVGADGSVFNKYPHFQARGAQALRDIFDWKKGQKDPIVMKAAEDGSGVGAALIAALTIKRIEEGLLAGIKNVDGMTDKMHNLTGDAKNPDLP